MSVTSSGTPPPYPNDEELNYQIKSEEFNAEKYIGQTIKFQRTTNPQDLIDLLLISISGIESEIKDAEDEVIMEEDNLKFEWKLNQINSDKDVKNMRSDFNTIKEKIEDIKTIVNLEDDSIAVVSEELKELNQEINQKKNLRKLLDIIDSIEDPDEFQRKNIDLTINLSDLAIIQNSIENHLLDQDEDQEVSEEDKITRDGYIKLKLEISKMIIQHIESSINGLNTSLDENNFLEVRRHFYDLVSAKHRERVEDEIISHIFGKVGSIGTTDKEEQVNRFKRVLLMLNHHLKEFNDKEGLIYTIDSDIQGLIMRVGQRVTKYFIVEPSKKLFKFTSERDKDYFLFYYDDFKQKFKEFTKKCEKYDSIWNMVENVSMMFKELENDYLNIYTQLEKEQYDTFLKVKIHLEEEKVSKISKEYAELKDEGSKQIFDQILVLLGNERIEEFIIRTKQTIDRCYRNSPVHKRAEYSADFLINFIHSIFSFLADLLEMSQSALPNPQQQNPARVQPFKIAGQVLFLTKRIDLLFMEFKSSITNMFKLDEAEKIKLKSMTHIQELSSTLLNDSLGNLCSNIQQFSEIGLRKEKKSKSSNDGVSQRSATCELIMQLLASYVESMVICLDNDLAFRTLEIIVDNLLEVYFGRLQASKVNKNLKMQMKIDFEEYKSIFQNNKLNDNINLQFKQINALIELIGLSRTNQIDQIKQDDIYGTISTEMIDMFSNVVQKTKKR